MTAEIHETDDALAGDTASSGPGAKLKAAREAKKMSIKDVQASLRLDEATVAALEADDYQFLSTPIFAKGYLRSYARLLELNENQLLAEFEAQVQMDPPPLVPLAAHGDADRITIPWRAIFIAIGAVALILLAYLLFRMLPDFGGSEETEVSAGDLFIPRQSAETPVFENAPDIVVQKEERSQKASVTETTPVDPASLPITTALPDGQIMAESELAIDFESQEAAAQQAAEDESGTVAEVGQAAAGLLQMTVSQESWVEAYDATGRRLIYGLLKPGQVRRVSGRLPYRVLVGNSNGVEVMFDGVLFDYEEFTRQNVARFTLGQ